MLFVILVNIGCIKALDDQALFKQGYDYYKQKEFSQALNCYNQMIHKNNAVLFNIGNCYYKLNQYGQALASWKAAQKNWGWSSMQELEENICQAKKKLQIDQEKNSRIKAFCLALGDSIALGIRRTPLLWFQIFAIISWIFLFGFVTMTRRKKKRGIIVPIFAFLALTAGLLGLKYGQHAQLKAIIVVEQASVRTGPGQDFQLLTTLQEGREMSIKKINKEFAKIQSPNGLIGWVALQELAFY